MSIVPDALPTLSAGAHEPGRGEACVMEYVSLLAGEEWSDRPECTHPLLAHEARVVNDELLDRDRHLLVPLIGRLFGTAADSPEIAARLRLRQARNLLRTLDPSARGRVQALVERAERYLPLGGDDDHVAQARDTARSFPVPAGDLEPSHAAVHERAAMMLAWAINDDVESAEAWALAACVVGHRLAAGGECRAACGEPGQHARLKVRDLGSLLDEYDDVTGRTARDLTETEVAELVAQL